SHFRYAEERFRAAVKRPLESDVSTELLRYFEIRRKWEDREYIVPVTSDLEFLSEAKRRFHGERFEGLYSAWHCGRLTEQVLRQEFCQRKPQHTVYLDTVYVSDHRSYLERHGNGGERPRKDAVHPYVHRSVHPAVNGSVEEHWGCAPREEEFGRGQNTGLGWNDPPFWAWRRPKRPVGSFQPSLGKHNDSQGVLPAPRNPNRKEKQMPLISKVPEILSREYKLEDYVVAAVENYSKMIDSTPDHVVNSALKMIPFKDKDYSRWRKDRQGTTGKKEVPAQPRIAGAKA